LSVPLRRRETLPAFGGWRQAVRHRVWHAMSAILPPSWLVVPQSSREKQSRRREPGAFRNVATFLAIRLGPQRSIVSTRDGGGEEASASVLGRHPAATISSPASPPPPPVPFGQILCGVRVRVLWPSTSMRGCLHPAQRHGCFRWSSPRRPSVADSASRDGPAGFSPPSSFLPGRSLDAPDDGSSVRHPARTASDNAHGAFRPSPAMPHPDGLRLRPRRIPRPGRRTRPPGAPAVAELAIASSFL